MSEKDDDDGREREGERLREKESGCHQNQSVIHGAAAASSQAEKTKNCMNFSSRLSPGMNESHLIHINLHHCHHDTKHSLSHHNRS